MKKLLVSFVLLVSFMTGTTYAAEGSGGNVGNGSKEATEQAPLEERADSSGVGNGVIQDYSPPGTETGNG